MKNEEKLIKDGIKKYTAHILSDFVENFRYDVAESIFEYYKNNKNSKKHTESFKEGFKKCSDIILDTLNKSENSAKEKINRLINDEELNKNAL